MRHSSSVLVSPTAFLRVSPPPSQPWYRLTIGSALPGSKADRFRWKAEIVRSRRRSRKGGEALQRGWRLSRDAVAHRHEETLWTGHVRRRQSGMDVSPSLFGRPRPVRYPPTAVGEVIYSPASRPVSQASWSASNRPRRTTGDCRQAGSQCLRADWTTPPLVKLASLWGLLPRSRSLAAQYNTNVIDRDRGRRRLRLLWPAMRLRVGAVTPWFNSRPHRMTTLATGHSLHRFFAVPVGVRATPLWTESIPLHGFLVRSSPYPCLRNGASPHWAGADKDLSSLQARTGLVRRSRMSQGPHGLEDEFITVLAPRVYT